MFNKIQKYTMLFCLVYFTSYITRINYATALIDIAGTLEISNSLAGIPVSLSFISYGFGQLLSGYFGDKFNSIKVISAGILLTALMNFSVVLTDNIYVIAIFWTINGFAQSLLWPPLVKIMLSVFQNEQYKVSCAYVLMSSSVATIAIYLLVPACINLYSYKLVFIISAIFAVIVLFVWYFYTKDIELQDMEVKRQSKSSGSVIKMILSLNLIPILIVIVLQGMLRDGVTTWMPTFINEVFNFSASNAVLITSVLPVFSIVTIIITRAINKKSDNEILLSAYFWCVATLAGVCLFIFMDNMVVAISSLTVLTSCMHATNLLLIGNLPAKFVKYGKVSTISGVLNSCTYVGSTISAYAIAKLAELLGWSGNVIIWIVIAGLGAVLCFLNVKLNKKLK